MTVPKFTDGSLVTIPEKYGSMVFEVDEAWLDEDDGTQCYYLSNEQGYMGIDAMESELKAFMSAEVASKRKIPTPDEFAKAYDWLSDPFSEDFTLSESDQEGDGKVGLYGRTADGLAFYVIVRVERIERAD